MNIIMYDSGVCQPEDKGIVLADILEYDGDFVYMSDKFINRQSGRKCLRDDVSGKAVTLCALEYVKNGRQGDYISSSATNSIKVKSAKNKNPEYTKNYLQFDPNGKGNKSLGRLT